MIGRARQSLPQEDDKPVVGERAQERCVSDVPIDTPESLEQGERESTDVGRGDEGSYSSPIAQCELGMKGSRELADGKKAYRNPARNAPMFGAPSPAGFARLTPAQVPGGLPKANWPRIQTARWPPGRISRASGRLMTCSSRTLRSWRSLRQSSLEHGGALQCRGPKHRRYVRGRCVPSRMKRQRRGRRSHSA